MALLADLFQVFILITCLIGLGLASRRVFVEIPFGLHFCLAPLALVAVLFFLEHFLPLGQPRWLWLPGLAVSCWLIRRAERPLWRETVLWYFLFGFGVCFFWRFSLPDIYPYSDNLCDLALLVSNSLGKTLPADDIWLKGGRQDVYYIYQFYAGGLIHRFMGCNYGLTYHLAYCTIAGYCAAAISLGVETVTKSLRAGWFACCCLVLGGNGATLVTPFMEAKPSFYASMRFIGSYAVPATPEYKSDFAVWLIHFIGESKVDAPMEYFSYALVVGDYHPPLSGFLFLAIAILAMCYAEVSPPGGRLEKTCTAAVMATPFFMLISDLWAMPLQALLVLFWFGYRRLVGRVDPWRWLFLTALYSLMVIAPFFLRLAHGSSSRYTPGLVQVLPPFLNWLLVMFPACVVWVACLFLSASRPLARLVTLLGLVTFLGTYFVYIHDDYGGQFAIFNTTMKTWAWAYTFVVIMGLVCVWPHPIWRTISIVILSLSVISNVYIFSEYWEVSLGEHPDLRQHVGRLDGCAWFTDDDNQRALFQEVMTLPKGVILESNGPPDLVTPSVFLAPYSENYSVDGCSWQEIQRRSGREDLIIFSQKLDQFYLGTLDDAASWLRAAAPAGITYVIWTTRDNGRGAGIWEKMNNQIKSDYDWRSTNQEGANRWGIWIQRSRPDRTPPAQPPPQPEWPPIPATNAPSSASP